MTIPNIKSFLEFASPEIELTDYQIELAEAIIQYRILHHSGGRGGGRTFVIDAVQSYFSTCYPNSANDGKEI